MRQIVIVGVACGAGAPDPGCADAPDAIRGAGLLADLELGEHAIRWEVLIRSEPTAMGDALLEVADVATRVAERVRTVVRRGDFPIVIGGDHSIAAGTWSGVWSTLAGNARLGLVWIDAHLDSHTFATTPSRAIHGMPLACLLGRGSPLLTQICGARPKILPQDLCIIGARSFEWKEMELLKSLGVRIYFMPEIRERGMVAVVEEAVRHVADGTQGFGISFDLDVLDPSEEAGTGSPVADGLFRDEVLASLALIRGNPRLLALEVVEYNPHRDAGEATARVIHDICKVMAAV